MLTDLVTQRYLSDAHLPALPALPATTCHLIQICLPCVRSSTKRRRAKWSRSICRPLNSPDSSSDSHDEDRDTTQFMAHTDLSLPGTLITPDLELQTITTTDIHPPHYRVDTPTMIHAGLEPPPPFARQGRSYAPSYTDSQPQTRTSSPYPSSYNTIRTSMTFTMTILMTC